MSSDNQFTALGPAAIGFQTNGSNIDRGVDVSGNTFGVRGTCTGSVGDGVQGMGSGNFSGTAGFGGSNNGTGAFGVGGGSTGQGVRGIGAGGSNTNPGSPVGVYGQAGPNSDGVQGIGTGTTSGGVHGISNDTNGNGVIADANNGVSAFALWARSSNGLADMFEGNVLVQGDFSVTGAKSAVVAHPDGSHRRLYCTESPESWFEDFGFGCLVGGRAYVSLDPDFAALVHTDVYHVFVTEYDGTGGLTVLHRTSTGFDVRAATPGAVSQFSYRIVAKRKDIAGLRLERMPLPDKT